MRKKNQTFVFRMQNMAPETFPISRLAEYLAQIGKFFGGKKVYFSKVRKGSACLDFKTSDEQYSPNDFRELSVEQRKAERQINKMLNEDKSSASLKSGRANIIKFPGNVPEKQEICEVRQRDFIDGVVTKISLSKKENKVSIVIMENDGETKDFFVEKDLAKEIAPFVFDVSLRFYGEACWRRSEEGMWSLTSFSVNGYDRLETDGIHKLIDDISNFEGNKWNEIKEPLKFWKQNIRGCE